MKHFYKFSIFGSKIAQKVDFEKFLKKVSTDTKLFKRNEKFAQVENFKKMNKRVGT